MIKKLLLLCAVVLPLSILLGTVIFAKKDSPEETVKKYWQYLLDKNCQKIDELDTNFTGYRKDEHGQIYRVQLTATVKDSVTGEQREVSKLSNCYVAEEVELFGSKYFKILKSDVDEELRIAHIRILTRDKYGVKQKYNFSLSKDPQGDIWKIIGFLRVIDEKDE